MAPGRCLTAIGFSVACMSMNTQLIHLIPACRQAANRWLPSTMHRSRMVIVVRSSSAWRINQATRAAVAR